MHVYVCMHASQVYVYIYIYTYVHIHKHTYPHAYICISQMSSIGSLFFLYTMVCIMTEVVTNNGAAGLAFPVGECHVHACFYICIYVSTYVYNRWPSLLVSVTCRPILCVYVDTNAYIGLHSPVGKCCVCGAHE